MLFPFPLELFRFRFPFPLVAQKCSHSHGNPMGIPWEWEFSFPCTPLVYTAAADVSSFAIFQRRREIAKDCGMTRLLAEFAAA